MRENVMWLNSCQTGYHLLASEFPVLIKKKEKNGIEDDEDWRAETIREKSYRGKEKWLT